jgi:hypothetical protein
MYYDANKRTIVVTLTEETKQNHSPVDIASQIKDPTNENCMNITKPLTEFVLSVLSSTQAYPADYNVNVAVQLSSEQVSRCNTYEDNDGNPTIWKP